MSLGHGIFQEGTHRMPTCNKESRELPFGEDWMGVVPKGEGRERQGSVRRSALIP